MIGEEGHAVPDGYRTWKDGINEPERVVCAFCSLPFDGKLWSQFDHAICQRILVGRGVVNGPFTRVVSAEALARSGGPGSTGSVAEGPSSKTVRDPSKEDERARRPGRECACGPTTTSMECPWHN